MPLHRIYAPMKKESADNKLCLTCRRSCKQPASVIIASCPRYYVGTRIKRSNWKQLELAF